MAKVFLSTIVLAVMIYAGSRSWGSIPPVMDLLSPHTGIWQLAPPALEETYHWEALDAPVDIVLDDRQVPHIFGQANPDVAYALGYLHAKDRLFQMDVTSRFTLGQLAGLLGSDLADIDRLSRRRGLPTSCERQADKWQSMPEANTILSSYADGVNAYIATLDHRSLPIEYRLLGKRPSRWSILHTAAIMKSMTFDLCFKNKDDISSATRTAFGPAVYNLLYPDRYAEDRPIIPEGTSWDYITEDLPAPDDLGLLPDLPLGHPQTGLPPEGIGSNNWAVSGERTTSGHPILCNDPHLTLRLPSIWYEAQLTTPDASVYGVTIPGIPVVIIGYTDRIAWGVTNWGGDVLDWFKIDWVDRDKLTYRLDGKIEQAERRTFPTDIEGKPGLDTVVWTYWGPVTYYDEAEHRLKDYAMKWIGHLTDDNDELATFMNLAKATTVDDIVAATQQFRSPMQNFAFATKTGDIGLRISGAMPIRPSGSGAFVTSGDQTSHDWLGMVPQDHHPLVINPECGYISSANQVSTDTTYPYAYHGYFSDWRGRLLNQVLDTVANVSVEDMKRLQQDDQSLLSITSIATLTALIDEAGCSPREREVLTELSTWDHRFDAEDQLPIYSHEWFKRFYSSTWDEMPVEAGLRVPDHRQTLILARDTPSLAFFDHQATADRRENAADIAHLTLRDAVTYVDSLIEADADYTWSDHNGNRVRHLLRLDPFSSPVNPISGDKYALNAANSTHGPSWRMVVELSDPVRAWGIYPGGASGHPGSDHYDADVRPWALGDYHELHLYQDLAAAKTAASHHISCQP